MNDSTVINNPPISVTAHKGILSKNPQSSMVVTISAGKVVCSGVPNPAAFIMVEIVPCTILNKASISSIPYVITPFASAKRTKSFSACSGFFTSVKLPQVFTIPITKNNTSKASPIAWTAPLMSTITFQIFPPLKFCGVVVMSVHISDSFSFQVSRAFSRFWTTQLSLIQSTSLQLRGVP